MPGWLIQVAGAAVVLLALADVFLTVLYARTGTAILSETLGALTWRAFRAAARRAGRAQAAILSYCGPTVLLLTVAMWVTLLLLGFALIFWPGLGTGVQATRGPTPTDFGAALYLSGYTLTTVGNGDLQPMTTFYRMVIVVD